MKKMYSATALDTVNSIVDTNMEKDVIDMLSQCFKQHLLVSNNNGMQMFSNHKGDETEGAVPKECGGSVSIHSPTIYREEDGISTVDSDAMSASSSVSLPYGGLYKTNADILNNGASSPSYLFNQNDGRENMRINIPKKDVGLFLESTKSNDMGDGNRRFGDTTYQNVVDIIGGHQGVANIIRDKQMRLDSNITRGWNMYPHGASSSESSCINSNAFSFRLFTPGWNDVQLPSESIQYKDNSLEKVRNVFNEFGTRNTVGRIERQNRVPHVDNGYVASNEVHADYSSLSLDASRRRNRIRARNSNGVGTSLDETNWFGNGNTRNIDEQRRGASSVTQCANSINMEEWNVENSKPKISMITQHCSEFMRMDCVKKGNFFVDGSEKEANYTLIVNVPGLSTKQDVINAFSQFGKIELATIVCDRRHRHPHKEWTATAGYAFVRFFRRDDAERALREHLSLKIRGCRLRATWAKKDSYAKEQIFEDDFKKVDSPFILSAFDEFTCKLCSCLVCQPVVMECGHICCDQCLKSWIRTGRGTPKCAASQRNTSNGSFSCPVCNYKTYTSLVAYLDESCEGGLAIVYNVLNNVVVKCSTCMTWIGTYSNYKRHSKNFSKAENDTSMNAASLRQ